MATINDGSTVPLTGFSGTITGLTQATAEESNGARKTERVKAEDNTTGAVVFTGLFKEVSLNAHVLTAFAKTVKVSDVLAYNSVNYRVTGAPVTSTRTLSRIALTMRKEASMTYTPTVYA